MQIPFHRPSIGREEIDEVVRTLESGWLTTGPKTAQFEQDFRTYIDAPHALAVNSATAGLHLALAALNIGAGDEVITTPLTFCSTVTVIMHVGATPALADIGPDGNIDPDAVAARVTERTRAIMPVHLAGLPCDMDALWAIARRHGLAVIEDAAHAVGARYGSRLIGAGPSDAVAFSFYATKNLTTGEGGMVTTRSEEFADSMRLRCLHGMSKGGWDRYSDRGNWYYEVLLAGFKYNLSDIQAAIGIHQLRKLEQFIEVRTKYARFYREALADVEEIDLPPDDSRCRHAWHLYMIRLKLDKLEIGREEFIRALRDRGIGTSVHFIPIPMHPFFASFATRRENLCPLALGLYPRLVSIPLYPAMTEAQLEYVAQSVAEIARKARRRKPVSVGAAAG